MTRVSDRSAKRRRALAPWCMILLLMCFTNTFPCSRKREFASPSLGVDNDWVLVLDEATQDYSIPGVPARVQAKDVLMGPSHDARRSYKRTQ
jgi:hypothetical protein